MVVSASLSFSNRSSFFKLSLLDSSQFFSRPVNLQMLMSGTHLLFVRFGTHCTKKNQGLSWCQICRHWWHRIMSLWQPMAPPATTKLALWQLLVCSVVEPIFTRYRWRNRGWRNPAGLIYLPCTDVGLDLCVHICQKLWNMRTLVVPTSYVLPVIRSPPNGRIPINGCLSICGHKEN